MRVIVGVGGGIAAYKAAELVRALGIRGFACQVVMTRAAEQFITPLTFASLTGEKVITDLFPQSPAGTLSSAVEHIGVAQEADLLVVAPATADLLAKFAAGLADDFLTTLHLAFRGPILLAPAMNTNMWEHPATQSNLDLLRSRGCIVIEPDSGALACGTVGAGRLPDPDRIAEIVAEHLTSSRAPQPVSRRDLEGDCIVITAGPTVEPIDPVRYISNRSSGKMGYALAEAAAKRGARVKLISGPVRLASPAGVEMVHIQTAAEMRDAVFSSLADATVVIKAAAVSDYHVAEPPAQKLKKTAARISLTLDPTPDILAELGSRKRDYLLIGFAAETQNVVEEGRRKLIAKNCDMIVANLVGREGTGFEADENEVDIVTRTGQTVHAGPASKTQIADVILNQISAVRLAIHASSSKTLREEALA